MLRERLTPKRITFAGVALLAGSVVFTAVTLATGADTTPPLAFVTFGIAVEAMLWGIAFWVPARIRVVAVVYAALVTPFLVFSTWGLVTGR